MDRTVGAGGEEECDLTTEGMEFTEKKKGKQVGSDLIFMTTDFTDQDRIVTYRWESMVARACRRYRHVNKICRNLSKTSTRRILAGRSISQA